MKEDSHLLLKSNDIYMYKSLWSYYALWHLNCHCSNHIAPIVHLPSELYDIHPLIPIQDSHLIDKIQISIRLKSICIRYAMWNVNLKHTVTYGTLTVTTVPLLFSIEQLIYQHNSTVILRHFTREVYLTYIRCPCGPTAEVHVDGVVQDSSNHW